jgi:hypothetical protein
MARIKYKEAAGLKVKTGITPIGKKPSRSDLERLYIIDQKSIREIASILECSKDMIYRSIKEYGIKPRDGSRRSKLRKIDKSILKKEIKNKGITKAAKELSVDVRTLKKFV